MKTEDIDKRIGMPDVDKEWARFEQEVIGKETKRHSALAWALGIGIAASVALLLIYNIGKEQTEEPLVAQVQPARPEHVFEPARVPAKEVVTEVPKPVIAHNKKLALAKANAPAASSLDIPAREYTGAVQKFKMDDIEDLAFESVDQALQGQIAERDIASADLGSGTTMHLRGIGESKTDSFLVVVNGKKLFDSRGMTSEEIDRRIEEYLNEQGLLQDIKIPWNNGAIVIWASTPEGRKELQRMIANITIVPTSADLGKDHVMRLDGKGINSVAAYDAKIDGIYYNFSGDEATVTYQTYQPGSERPWLSDYSGSVVIPSSVTYNGKTYRVTSIGEYAFFGGRDLTSITIPESVTSIGNVAFYGCSSLNSITIPNSVTDIYDGAFEGCSSLTSITIPNSVTDIYPSAFRDCSSLTSVTIPESVTCIESDTFNGCSGLTTITIPNSVKSIDFGAFQGCSSLTSITIPESVTEIDSYAFRNCRNLRDVYCYAKNVPTTEADAFRDVNLQNVTLHVPAGEGKSYRTTAPWSSFMTSANDTDLLAAVDMPKKLREVDQTYIENRPNLRLRGTGDGPSDKDRIDSTLILVNGEPLPDSLKWQVFGESIDDVDTNMPRYFSRQGLLIDSVYVHKDSKFTEKYGGLAKYGVIEIKVVPDTYCDAYVRKHPKLMKKYTKVEGYVVDNDGKPLTEAYVHVEQNFIGAATDSTGHFVFWVPRKDVTLRAEQPGYKSFEFSPTDKNLVMHLEKSYNGYNMRLRGNSQEQIAGLPKYVPEENEVRLLPQGVIRGSHNSPPNDSILYLINGVPQPKENNKWLDKRSYLDYFKGQHLLVSRVMDYMNVKQRYIEKYGEAAKHGVIEYICVEDTLCDYYMDQHEELKASRRRVTGVVYDENDEPLEHTMIHIFHDRRIWGTETTDSTGHFVFWVPRTDATLHFKYIGYKAVVVEATDTFHTIYLLPEATERSMK